MFRLFYAYFQWLGMRTLLCQKECEIGRSDFSTTKINLNLMHGIYNDLMDLQLEEEMVASVSTGEIPFRKIACETKNTFSVFENSLDVCVSVIKSKEPVLLNLIK